jgi:hypothetical protein
MSLKNPVTPPGIDPGTVRLVARHLNHYATQGTAVGEVFFILRILCVCVDGTVILGPIPNTCILQFY